MHPGSRKRKENILRPVAGLRAKRGFRGDRGSKSWPRSSQAAWARFKLLLNLVGPGQSTRRPFLIRMAWFDDARAAETFN